MVGVIFHRSHLSLDFPCGKFIDYWFNPFTCFRSIQILKLFLMTCGNLCLSRREFISSTLSIFFGIWLFIIFPYNLLYFSKTCSNVSSFILYFINLSHLPFFRLNQTKVLSTLSIPSKNKLLVLLIFSITILLYISFISILIFIIFFFLIHLVLVGVFPASWINPDIQMAFYKELLKDKWVNE